MKQPAASGDDAHPIRQRMRELLSEPPQPGNLLPAPNAPFLHVDDADVHFEFRVNDAGTGVVGEVTLGAAHEGAVGVVHGGMLTALLDQVFGMAGSVSHGPVVTRHLAVTFHHPTWIGQPMDVHGTTIEADGKDLTIEGECRQNGKVTVSAVGHFIRVPVERILNPAR